MMRDRSPGGARCSGIGLERGAQPLAPSGMSIFAFVETLRWSPSKVREIAPAWLEGLTEADATRVGGWAKRLAFHVGIFNLVLGMGLAWTCRAFYMQAPTAKSLGIYFAIWLILAAAAAYYTQVPKAFKAQGVLGVAL